MVGLFDGVSSDVEDSESRDLEDFCFTIDFCESETKGSRLLQSCLLTGVRRNVCLPGATASSSTRLPSGTGSHRFSGNSRSGHRSGGKTDLIVVDYILVGDKIKVDANTCETTPPYLTMVLTWAKKECWGRKQESREVFLLD